MITLADVPELMRALAVHPDGFDATIRHSEVWAPCCARKTPADTIVSLLDLRTEIRGGNFLPKRDLDWACDGCRHLLILDKSNGWTWSNLFTALGADDESVRHYLAKEVEEEARVVADREDAVRQRAGLAAIGFNPQEVYETAREFLPADLADEPALRRPDLEPTEIR